MSVILSANVASKPIEVLFDIDPALPKMLCGDAMRLQQVLINLGGNAIKFTSQGEVVLQIKVTQQTPQRAVLRIAVRDSGIGIALENQAHIFDGFSQAEASTTRRFGGTGLGLSICKRLVQLMGGELALDSQLNVGSTFHFTIALDCVEHLAGGTEPQAQTAVSALHVLVVDDNPVASQLLQAMAQSWGWQTDVANSGPQALAMLQARAAAVLPPFDAVFVDWLMPDMDGWETIARMRQLGAQARSPITVMVTAQGREMLSERSAQEQASLSAFLIKPITASMLLDTVVDARAGLGNLRATPRVKSEKSGRLSGMRLLVVEDNLINQQVARELLSEEGAIVEIAANGQLGVAAVAGADPPFHAVLMDLQMPVMDGFAATHAIRHEMGLTALPIIAMTANAMASDREACLRAGMDDHVGKPFDLPHLVDVLLQHTRRAKPYVPRQPSRDKDAHDRSASDATAGYTTPSEHSVNPEAAIARLAGNTTLYASIVKAYLVELGGQADQLDRLLQNDDLVGAARLLHTLKGVSATVGADYMAAIAKAAEAAVKRASPGLPLDDLRAHVRSAALGTMRAMEALVHQYECTHVTNASKAVAGALSAADRQQLGLALAELKVLLENSDLRALTVHQQLVTRYPLAAKDGYDALEQAISAFNFVQAAAQCAQLFAKLDETKAAGPLNGQPFPKV